ncbi:hypothetical protein BEI60_23075 [Eisenbergiella tayi]|nr:hypothetical protein BEI60_23075 [Eisenbergiella tayi]
MTADRKPDYGQQKLLADGYLITQSLYMECFPIVNNTGPILTNISRSGLSSSCVLSTACFIIKMISSMRLSINTKANAYYLSSFPLHRGKMISSVFLYLAWRKNVSTLIRQMEAQKNSFSFQPYPYFPGPES